MDERKPRRIKIAPKPDGERRDSAERGERAGRPGGERRAPRPGHGRGEPRDARPPRGGRDTRPGRELVLEEGKIYGVNACHMFFAHRRNSLVRAYFTEDTAKRFGEVMKYCAGERLAYHIVDEQEMERITASTHHEGVCFLIKKLPPLSVGAWLKANGRVRRQAVLVLENVGNPHNLGAILRICAHFGVPAVAVNDPGAMTSGAAVRTAEGGAEFVEVLAYTNLEHLLAEFHQAGYTIVTTTSHGGSDLFLARMPEKALILFGEESKGLSKKALAAGDVRVKIPGTAQVESLNVSTATAIVLAEYWRQHH